MPTPHASPTDKTIDYACDALDLPNLDRQHVRFVLNRYRGLSTASSARAAGLLVKAAQDFESTEQFQALLNYLHEHSAKAVGITVEKLTTMFLDAYDRAATAGEMVSATRELGVLHDLYPQKNNSSQVNVLINQTIEKTDKQLKQLPNEELLKIAGGDLVLEPESVSTES